HESFAVVHMALCVELREVRALRGRLRRRNWCEVSDHSRQVHRLVRGPERELIATKERWPPSACVRYEGWPVVPATSESGTQCSPATFAAFWEVPYCPRRRLRNAVAHGSDDMGASLVHGPEPVVHTTGDVDREAVVTCPRGGRAALLCAARSIDGHLEFAILRAVPRKGKVVPIGQLVRCSDDFGVDLEAVVEGSVVRAPVVERAEIVVEVDRVLEEPRDAQLRREENQEECGESESEDDAPADGGKDAGGGE